MLAVLGTLVAPGCAHVGSTVPAAFNAFASGVIDRSTSQVSIAGVATAESKDSNGVVHDGGFGARIRAIRRGGSRATANVIASNWLEAGTWDKGEGYYNSGTTLGYGFGGASWFAGMSFGLQYGGYRTSALLLPIKAHFLYVGRIQLNAEAWSGQRFGAFGSSDPSFTNAMGWSASIGLGGSPRGAVSESRRGFGLGIFSEKMDGVTVTGLSLEWQFSTANIPRGSNGGNGGDQSAQVTNQVKCNAGDATACRRIAESDALIAAANAEIARLKAEVVVMKAEEMAVQAAIANSTPEYRLQCAINYQVRSMIVTDHPFGETPAAELLLAKAVTQRAAALLNKTFEELLASEEITKATLDLLMKIGSGESTDQNALAGMFLTTLDCNKTLGLSDLFP